MQGGVMAKSKTPVGGAGAKKSADLISEIAKARSLSLDDDPRVREAEKCLEDLHKKSVCIQEKIDGLKTELARKEREIGDHVLRGGSMSVAALTQLRRDLAESEDESRIHASVVQQAGPVA